MTSIDPADTAWLLVATALVCLMTPALALFYGGMVRAKNVLSTTMHSFGALAVVSIAFPLVGYTLAFGPTQGGVIGGLDHLFLRGVGTEPHGTIPHILFVAFQTMFAVITPALIAGAFAERLKFSSFIAFTLLWSLLVYSPLCHWVWGPGGWLAKRGALDFAGGTVIHLASGVSALVFAVVLGPRRRWPDCKAPPHNLTLTMLGAGLLWVGWFGFNAGSALGANGIAALALMNTHLAAAAGAIAWASLEWWKHNKPSALGAASGLVAGLVAVTPAAGFVGPLASIAIGLAAGGVCFAAVLLKTRLRYDDALDAFGVHGVGGALGAILTGVFASTAWNAAGQDGLIAGSASLLGEQVFSVLAAGTYAVVATFGILKLVSKTMGLRVSEEEEAEGLDAVLHGEPGYVFGDGGVREAPRARDEDMVPARSILVPLTATEDAEPMEAAET